MYSEFAYSREMQLVLMVIAFIYNYIQMYYISALIMRIHGEKASVSQKSLFAFATGAIVYTLFIYLVYYIGGMMSFNAITYQLVVTPNPITALLYCVLAIRILKLSPVRSIELIGNVYLYYAIVISITRLVGAVFFVQTAERYNYMLDAARNITSLAIFFTIYGATWFVLSKKPTLIVPKTNAFVDLRKDWAYFIVKAFLVYLCLVLCPLLISETVIAHTVILIFLSLLLVLTILLTNYVYVRSDNRHKEAHIKSMNRTTEEFRAVKHDFYNILNTYGGFLAVGDLNACRKYHEKFSDMTMRAGASLDLSKKAIENPALVSLLMDKRARADQAGVHLDIAIKCSLTNLPMDEIDICRVISCLIDNAIEAATESEQKHVSISVEQKAEDTRLLMIVNSTARQPDMNLIFTEGVTSKAGHQGIGLSSVRKIINRYGNCTFQLNCYDNVVTAYVELRG